MVSTKIPEIAALMIALKPGNGEKKSYVEKEFNQGQAPVCLTHFN